MSIKKAFQPIVDFLEANSNKKVSSILDEVLLMCTAKGAGSGATTCYRDAEGNVTLVRCGYYQQWLPVNYVEFSAKANTASGYAPMCKEGQSLWSKKQRDAKKAKEELLAGVANGSVEPASIADELETIEAERLARDPHPLGSNSVEEALEKDFDALAAQLVEDAVDAVDGDAEVEPMLEDETYS